MKVTSTTPYTPPQVEAAMNPATGCWCDGHPIVLPAGALKGGGAAFLDSLPSH